MKKISISMCVALLMIFQAVQADSMSGHPGISKFAACSQQCMKDNENCKKKAKDKCKKDDESCYEACNIAYPDCMAKCPKPGT